jgi:hypothetical protein
MLTLAWQGRLDEASSEDAVVVVCRDFLALWTPKELAELPAICLPQVIVEGDEVNTYALKLIRHLGVGDRASAPMLHRMSTFFTRAALRLAQMRAHMPEIPAKQRNSGSRSSD